MISQKLSLTLFLTLILSTAACTLNQQSQDAYISMGESKNEPEFRHGIVPLATSTTTATTTSTTNSVNKSPIDPKMAAAGKLIYDNHCLKCHGNLGLGDGELAKNLPIKPKNLQQLVKEVPQFNFFMLVSQYKGTMPGWKTVLSDKEIRNLEIYIKTLIK